MSVFLHIIKSLPDVFSKKEDSNIGKLVKILSEQIDDLTDTFVLIEIWRDINQAEGTTLDKIGKDVGQYREDASDNAYRILIKSKILRDRSDGTIDDLIKNLAYLLQIQESEVVLHSQYEENIPASLYSEVDLSKILLMDLTVERFSEILNNITGTGVSMDIWFRGSFLFSDDDQIQEDIEQGFGEVVSDELYHQGDFTFSSIKLSQTDTEKGFASDDMGEGGRFGALYRPDDSIKIRPW